MYLPRTVDESISWNQAWKRLWAWTSSFQAKLQVLDYIIVHYVTRQFVCVSTTTMIRDPGTCLHRGRFNFSVPLGHVEARHFYGTWKFRARTSPSMSISRVLRHLRPQTNSLRNSCAFIRLDGNEEWTFKLQASISSDSRFLDGV